MVLGSHKGFSRIKKRFILLLVFIPLFLLLASFFVYVAAQESESMRDVAYWNKNREQIALDYNDEQLTTNIAGIVQLTENYKLPFYSSVESNSEGAFLFGDTLPGDAGRTIIMGHQEQGFYYLSKLSIGDLIVIESYKGEYRYIVSSASVCVPSEIPLDNTEESVLTLVSKYPFMSLSLTNRRYVVEAVLE
ncbi:MAG: sortase [Eubacteriales bacterium]